MKNIPDTRMFESVFAVRRRAMRSCQFLSLSRGLSTCMLWAFPDLSYE